MSRYGGALYQQDLISALAKKVAIELYGPGFPAYSKKHSIHDVIRRCSEPPDCILVGHSWLSDKSGDSVDPHPKLKIEEAPIPKGIILNKEYVNLEEKLRFIREKSFNFAFSHHHSVELFQKRTGITFRFLPFAYDEERFQDRGQGKVVALTFSGILQNKNSSADQSDVRVRVMRHLFQCRGDLPIKKRERFLDKNIVWNSIPRDTGSFSKISYSINSILYPRYRYKRIPTSRYTELLAQSKVVLNTPSPMGLISPRFFEAMGSKALVLCEHTSDLERQFPKGVLVTFRPDMSDFDKKFDLCIHDESYRTAITEKAFTWAVNNHTWRHRADQVIKVIRSSLN
jgi:hypothetical protein